MYEWGLMISTLVSVPSSSTFLFTSNCAFTAWCATALVAIASVAANDSGMRMDRFIAGSSVRGSSVVRLRGRRNGLRKHRVGRNAAVVDVEREIRATVDGLGGTRREHEPVLGQIAVRRVLAHELP